MGLVSPARIVCRARQFCRAVAALLLPLTPAEQAEVRAYLSEDGWRLFQTMSRADQRHGLGVWRSLQASGLDHPALAQAALLHDCAKHEGVRLWHRVGIVLAKRLWPGWLARLRDETTLPHGSWRYPLWVHLHHPQRGAELAAAAGCDPLAVLLIRHHQDCEGVTDNVIGRLLAALQAADEHN